MLNQTPSAFKKLVAVDEVEESSGVAASNLALRWVIFGGEALEFSSLAGWLDRHGDQRPQLVNMYGITETTVHVTYRPISARDLADNPPSLIGNPMPDLQLYLLDAQQQPVPIGVSRSPNDFYSLLVREQVTVLNQTPSAFKQLMAVDKVEESAGVAESNLALRWVIFGGEALEFSSLAGWLDRHGDQRPQLVNMYGITETTVHVTYRPISARDLAEIGAQSDSLRLQEVGGRG